MNKTATEPPITVDLLLPDTALTLSGVEFHPNQDRWVYRDGVHSVSLNFSLLDGTTPQFRHGAKLMLIWHAQNSSPGHLMNGLVRLKHLVKTLRKLNNSIISIISKTDIINYKATLTPRNQWYLSSLAGFLKKWLELGIPGISENAVKLLNQLRLKGNAKGTAVLTMDPDKGPFTDIELQAIHTALDSAYSRCEISTANYLLCWLFMLLGQRSTQYASLKVCDVLSVNTKDETDSYLIRIPRAKQRGELTRASFKVRALTPAIGSILIKYAKDTELFFTGKIKNPKEAPLFPEQKNRLGHSKGFEYHLTSGSVAHHLKKILNSLNVNSERTGRRLHITSQRFRHTLGTRAAMEGHGELVIAELLDHSDTQSVGVYVQSTPEIVERIDRALAFRLAPLAQAFAGVIVDNDVRRDGKPEKSIVSPHYHQAFDPVGHCGKHGFCGFLAPLHCYTCNHFRAWLDGPHEAVLNHLLAERERLMVGTDMRIASINDRTILAVAQVIKQCEALKPQGT